MSTDYDIRLEITYAYDSPAAANRALLRIMPLSGPEQQLISGYVSTDPLPDFRRDGVDFFGNPTTEIAHYGSMSEILFRFSGRVRRFGPPTSLDLSCPLASLGAEIGTVNSIGPSAPHHFLGESERLRIEPKIAAFAEDLTELSMPVFHVVQTMSKALHAHFEFDPEATEVTTTPLDAFESRRGVCQDISHVMITALRAIGIPAGYVSGFLRTTPPPGQPRLEGADAMHAWVRAWCGFEMGWIEIDPTNDLLVGGDHIAVAIGRDYADVAPVKGSSRTAGSHTTEHQVDVIPL
ncbi:Protein containing transglutaminase-like domain, putative cysteine protease [Rhodovulum sp. P5]|uniref:transglutaminase family protein n=1 Tax=Rhodovulum sp. P5 TaxID=1564506 RepID=UPI0009C25EC2|nr:transglutaminase family protein [Rhodovulum sp. P5]ARE41749.1 Protein containing transglutaminase-like domain, putative cysteine protease [Rhodovulum sp. P5]